MRKLICVVFVLLLFLVSVYAEEKKDKPYGECGIDNPQQGEEHARYIPTQEQRCLTKKGRIWGSTSKIYNCEHKGSLTSWGSGRTGSSADEFVWKPTEKTCKTGCASDGKRCKEDEEKCPVGVTCIASKNKKRIGMLLCRPEKPENPYVISICKIPCKNKDPCTCITNLNYRDCECTQRAKDLGVCYMCPPGFVGDRTVMGEMVDKFICKPDPAMPKR